ncbi:hypothetical protein FA15DRAFT_681962 [Coprinopsis marcescibilis]|uniref:BTB domain-containing protein n=1 Tax=Coprinopsis marcescibilis TaxID=230819 RepID=A0A5C3KNZ8_COPMA|nr:hypothetical protein FA15DRAFT_681962 [Coprinopsis marcescibilis]
MPSLLTSSSIPQLALCPFDNPEADLILRSSDSHPTDYRVFKLLLSLSSPFFSVLFTLPQPKASKYSSSKVIQDEIPVVQMAEDREVLDILLGFCYPLSAHSLPSFSSLAILQRVADASLKFEMDGILRHVRQELVSPRFLETQPIRVYALAYHYGWVEEMKLAARDTLRHSMPGPYVPELKGVSPAAYHRLQQYHRLCGEVAESRVLIQQVAIAPDDDWIWSTCRSCPGISTPCMMGSTNRAGKGSRPVNSVVYVRKWWSDWLHETAAQFRARPRGDCARNIPIMAKAVARAGGCPTCGKVAKGELESFAGALSAQVEKDLYSIELDLGIDE